MDINLNQHPLSALIPQPAGNSNKAVQFLRSLTGRKKRKGSAALIDVPDSKSVPPELVYWVGESAVFYVAPQLLVMQGAHKYASDTHPFHIGLEQGREAMATFYAEFAPENLCEMYRLDKSGLTGEDLAPWEMPWLWRERKAPKGEGGLKPGDGVSFFGPCTPRKVDLEMRRLTETVSSIRKKGYLPDSHGHIEGYFLQRDDEYRFFVLGGKHRTASLCHLEARRVPVKLRKNCPRVVRREDAANWPLVRSGDIDIELARKVFDTYF